MFTPFRLRILLPLAAIGIAALLTGCVYYPNGYYGYYGYTAPASVNFAFGGWGHDDHHWHHWDH